MTGATLLEPPVRDAAVLRVPAVATQTPLDLLFLIRTLSYGGAERQLVALATALYREGHRVRVAVFYPDGEGVADLASAGVPLISLDKAGRWDLLPFLVRLGRMLRRERPALLHGYLGSSNSLVALLRPIHGGRVVWGARASDIDISRYDLLARIDDRLERVLSRFPDAIIANSFAGRQHLIDRGFAPDRIRVIHNGIDVDRFRPDRAAREQIRVELGIGSNELLIGRVGRLDPQKDYPTFLRAAAIVASRRLRCRFVCVGYDPHGLRPELERRAADLGIDTSVTFAGQRHDMPAVFAALDLNVSSSAWGEGTPNAVAEGMACGVPAVVTDSGDSSWVVGDTGLVVPKGDPEALAQSIETMLDRIERGDINAQEIRWRIVDRMSLESLTNQTESALRSLLVEVPAG